MSFISRKRWTKSEGINWYDACEWETLLCCFKSFISKTGNKRRHPLFQIVFYRTLIKFGLNLNLNRTQNWVSSLSYVMALPFYFASHWIHISIKIIINYNGYFEIQWRQVKIIITFALIWSEILQYDSQSNRNKYLYQITFRLFCD